jgi:hypothetical protein
MATTGGSIEMGGTTAIQVASKQTTMAHNSTEDEIGAASFLGKIFRWLVLFMSDLGLPFQGPLPIAKDNAAGRSQKNHVKCPTHGNKNAWVARSCAQWNCNLHWIGTAQNK